MEVTMQQVLDAREQRAKKQKQLLAQYKKPLVCFTMNIAGPEKNNDLITAGFHLGHRWLTGLLQPVHQVCNIAPTGCEGYYVIDGDPLKIKTRTCQLEDSIPVGRLFDMDVLTPDGQKVSREQLGLPRRKCLLCQEDAQICGRSRAHSAQALYAEANRLLKDALDTQKADQLSTLAVQSLLYEVCTTPKPGLVDLRNNGSHRDMDLFTFMASAAALQPYFVRCVRIGIKTAMLSPAKTFEQLRLPGLLAELDMYAATGGVNTHKGAIFTLGLLCGAAGRLNISDTAAVLAEVKAMTEGLTANDFAGVTPENAVTNGQRLYVQHGITGVRGQAENGFPALLHGLAVLEEGLKKGLSVQDAGAAVLLHLLTQTVDTNLIARSDLQTQQAVTAQIKALLAEDPYPSRQTLEALDRAFTKKNLSPGGSADLLAAVYFLHLIK